MARTSSDRVRAYRERQRALKPPKQPPKSGKQRAKEYRERQKAMKLGLTELLPSPASLLQTTVGYIETREGPSTSYGDPLTNYETMGTPMDVPFTSPTVNGSEMVKKRWKGLKDVYRRVLKKSSRAAKWTKSGGWDSSGTTSNWIYSEDLEFMRDVLGPKVPAASLSSLPIDSFVETELGGGEEEDEGEVKMDQGLNGVESHTGYPHRPPLETILVRGEPRETSHRQRGGEDDSFRRVSLKRRTVDGHRSVSSNPTHSVRLLRKRARTALKRGNESFMKRLLIMESKKLLREVRKNNADDLEDEDYSFLLSVLPLMRKMDLNQKLLFRIRLQELLYVSFCGSAPPTTNSH